MPLEVLDAFAQYHFWTYERMNQISSADPRIRSPYLAFGARIPALGDRIPAFGARIPGFQVAVALGPLAGSLSAEANASAQP